MNTQEVFLNSKIKFGTSGARGLVSDFSAEVCFAFTISFIKMLQSEYKFSSVALGIDNRPSSISIAQNIASAIEDTGNTIDYQGVLPTPALAAYAISKAVPCIMVTGSHIPFDRNGLKFYTPKGEITKQNELEILSNEINFEVNNAIELTQSRAAIEYYTRRYLDFFENDSLAGKRVGIYEHSSAGRDIYKGIFEGLGAEVVSIERTNEFIPIDTEAVSETDKEKAVSWAKSLELDAVFTTDGDGDRPLLSDENGEWITGDILGLLASKILKLDALAVPISCNTSIEKCGTFQEVTRTKIGSPFVIEACESLSVKFSNVAGFEANGGFILYQDLTLGKDVLSRLPTRDALLPALAVLSKAKNEKVSKLVKEVEIAFTQSDRVKNFPMTKSKAIVSAISETPTDILSLLNIEDTGVASISTLDGVRITFTNDSIVHIRPSGNAPELRCYVESSNRTKTDKLLKTAIRSLESLNQ